MLASRTPKLVWFCALWDIKRLFDYGLLKMTDEQTSGILDRIDILSTNSSTDNLCEIKNDLNQFVTSDLTNYVDHAKRNFM